LGNKRRGQVSRVGKEAIVNTPTKPKEKVEGDRKKRKRNIANSRRKESRRTRGKRRAGEQSETIDVTTAGITNPEAPKNRRRFISRERNSLL